MNGQSVPPTLIRFGRFELDLDNRQLRRDGQPIRLQDQPFRTLAFLVQRAGNLVTRDELRAELWPEGTFVEFEHSLNTAIKKVRQALGEDAGKPEYIETVPRYGYRFIGEIVTEAPTNEEQAVAGEPRRFHLNRDGIAAVAAGLLCVVLAGALFRAKAPAHLARVSNLMRLTADPGLSFEPAVSQDGSLVAFASDRADAGNLDVWIAHVSGGAPIRLTDDPSDDYEPHFCPDGRIVFRSDRAGGGVYISPALGGTPTLIAQGGRNPQCSPDGKLVAYWIGLAETASSKGIYIVPSSGGAATRIAAELSAARAPLWAPDGKTLLVAGAGRSVPLNRDWWLVPTGGGAAKPLNIRAHLNRAMQFSSPFVQPATWAPSGEVIFAGLVGQTDVATTQTSLWALAISPDAATPLGRPTQLTSATGIHTGGSVSANGAIAFANLELNPDLWVMDLDHVRAKTTGALQRITSEKFWESRPIAREGSDRILFRTDRGGGWDFWQMDRRTRVARPVTISRELKVWGTLSRDGARLAYHAQDHVYVADVSTGASRPVCGNCRLQVSDWTPDGTGLIVNNLQTGSIDVLTVSDGRISPLISSVGRTLLNGSISPDGQTIAFIEQWARADAPGQLHTAPFHGLANIDPARWTTIAHDFVAPYTPQWSSNGKVLYFLSDADGPTCLWAARPDDSAKAFPVEHFHHPRYSLRGSFAVAGDRVYLGLHEQTGNVWLGSAR
jgi:Tol biopolymer transport system component/DNA-binding winged helix-turn-helix (wHTH) protein